MGRAINKTVTIVELIKVFLSMCTCLLMDFIFGLLLKESDNVLHVLLMQRRIVGLHQNTSIGSTDITDTWEPLEEGLLP